MSSCERVFMNGIRLPAMQTKASSVRENTEICEGESTRGVPHSKKDKPPTLNCGLAALKLVQAQAYYFGVGAGFTISDILNIGRNMQMTMPPTTTPRKTMRIGSMSEVIPES